MLRMVFFFMVMISLWALAHIYIGRRLIVPANLSARWRKLAWGALGAHFVIGLTAMLVRRGLPAGLVSDVLQWITYLGMGAFTLLLTLMVVKDLGWLVYVQVSRLRAKAATRRAQTEGAVADPARRLFMTNALNAGVITVATAGTKFGFYEARRLPDVVDVEVPIDGLPAALDGFRIVQLSDIHVGPTIRRSKLEAIVEAVNELDADLIAITGDLVDGYVDSLAHDVAPIGQLRARHGVYFATGNHEYYWDAPGWCDELERLGVHVLRNAHRIIDHGGGRLLVAGCTDYSAARHIPEEASDPEGAIAGAAAHDVSVLMAHQPKSIFAAERAGFDLQISGHTHGGQFWPWNHVVGLVHPFSVGLDRYNKTWIYVSRGTGYWGPPMRIGAPSEITVLRLVRAA